MTAANPDAVPRKFRRDSPALAAQASTWSRICAPMWPARKNEVPCCSAVIGPRVARSYPLKCSKTLNSIDGPPEFTDSVRVHEGSSAARTSLYLSSRIHRWDGPGKGDGREPPLVHVGS